MKKVLLGLVIALSVVGCRASVRVQASAPAPEPPPQAEPAPAPVAVEPKAGEQIVVPEQIEFEHDEARIRQTPKTLETLQKVADMMKAHPHITKLRVEGHTDSSGRAKHNDKLSKARAEAVARWLTDHDVAAGRIVTAGYGATRPLAANDTAERRAMNRRTEFYVDELDGKKVDDAGATHAAAAATSPGTPTSARTTNAK
jgi:OOP family OmpA-OmpF porin